MHYILRILASGLLLIPLSAQAYTQTTFTGLVVAVHDGDSLTVINERGFSEKIRLYKVDSPEMPYCYAGNCVPLQPYAKEARDALKDLCLGEVATVVRKRVSLSRTIGAVNCKGKDVSLYQLTRGNAWVYRYTSTLSALKIQNTARELNIGLWNKPHVEPYLWRRGIRQ